MLNELRRLRLFANSFQLRRRLRLLRLFYCVSLAVTPYLLDCSCSVLNPPNAMRSVSSFGNIFVINFVCFVFHARFSIPPIIYIESFTICCLGTFMSRCDFIVFTFPPSGPPCFAFRTSYPTTSLLQRHFFTLPCKYVCVLRFYFPSSFLSATLAFLIIYLAVYIPFGISVC